MANKCTIPPSGWQCSRKAGHDGPCAARPKYEFEDTPEFWLALARRVIFGARPRTAAKAPRWVAVADITNHGSTYSRDLCRFFDLDPDEMVKR